MRNIGLVNTAAIDFNDFEFESEIRFSYTNSNKSYDIGVNNRVFNVAHQYPTIVEYNVEIKRLRCGEYARLQAIQDANKTSLLALYFNDIADNYIIPISSNGANQYGKLVPLYNQPDQYQICKVYQFSDALTYRPIYLIPALSEIEVSLSGIVLEDTIDYDIDRNTGVITSSTNLTGADFSCSLFFTPVEIVDEIKFEQKYQKGQDVWAGADIPTEEDQEWSTSMLLRERIFNIGLDLNALDTSGNTLTAWDLTEFDSMLAVTDSHRIPEMEFKGMAFKKEAVNQSKNRSLTIRGHILRHRQLITFITLYRASKGTGVLFNA